MADDLTPRLKFACAAAREAGRLTLRYFRQDGLQVDLKQDASPVTVADREAEQLLRKQIAASFPQDGILGEEFGEQPGSSGFRWILDPIDGTKSFIYGVPLYSVLIGVEHESESRIGVIYVPAMDEMVYAARGQGAWHVRGSQPPKPARISKTKTLAEGLFCTSGLTGFHKRGSLDVFERLTKAAKVGRTWGDGFGYLLLATGRADVMVDPAMFLWDAAPLPPIMQEAGGTFTDWKGNVTIAAGEGIGTNGFLLDEVLRLVRG